MKPLAETIAHREKICRETPAEIFNKAQATAKRERWELELLRQIKAANLSAPVRQFKFHPTRRWKADFAWTCMHPAILCEVDGGVYSGGRHTRGAGFEADIFKLNEAAMLGFSVLRFTPSMIKSGYALETLCRRIPLQGNEA